MEDAEFAKTAAIKARQSAESDLSELNTPLEEVQRYKNEAESKCGRLIKEKAEFQTQVCNLCWYLAINKFGLDKETLTKVFKMYILT